MVLSTNKPFREAVIFSNVPDNVDQWKIPNYTRNVY